MSPDTIAIIIAAAGIMGTIIGLIFKIGQQNQKLKDVVDAMEDVTKENREMGKRIAFIEGRLQVRKGAT